MLFINIASGFFTYYILLVNAIFIFPEILSLLRPKLLAQTCRCYAFIFERYNNYILGAWRPQTG